MGGPVRAIPPPLAMPLMAMAIADTVSNYVALAAMRTKCAVTAAAFSKTRATACAARAGSARTRRAAARRPASSYWRSCGGAATTPPPIEGRTQEAPLTDNLNAPVGDRTANHAHMTYLRKPSPMNKYLIGLEGFTGHFTPGLTERLHHPSPKEGVYVFVGLRRSSHRPTHWRPAYSYLGGGNRVMMTMLKMARMGRTATNVLATPNAHYVLQRKRTPATDMTTCSPASARGIHHLGRHMRTLAP